MRCRAVSKTVRTDVGSVWHQRDPGVHHPANSTLVEATATRAKEDGRPAVGRRERRSASYPPPFNSLNSRDAEGNGPLLVALAEHPHHMPGTVEIIDVEPHQLAYSDAGRVQEFEDRIIT